MFPEQDKFFPSFPSLWKPQCVSFCFAKRLFYVHVYNLQLSEQTFSVFLVQMKIKLTNHPPLPSSPTFINTPCGVLSSRSTLMPTCRLNVMFVPKTIKYTKQRGATRLHRSVKETSIMSTTGPQPDHAVLVKNKTDSAKKRLPAQLTKSSKVTSLFTNCATEVTLALCHQHTGFPIFIMISLK